MNVPTIERRAYQYLAPMVDMILYVEVDKDLNRVLRTQPTKVFEAGDRSGRLSETIILGKDPSGKEGYNAIIQSYYGSDLSSLIDRINKGEQYLAENKIDGFDVPTRVKNSREKHLGSFKITDVTDAVILEKYLQHLRMKAQSKEKTNEVSAD
jgi:hypothetical protein